MNKEIKNLTRFIADFCTDRGCWVDKDLATAIYNAGYRKCDCKAPTFKYYTLDKNGKHIIGAEIEKEEK